MDLNFSDRFGIAPEVLAEYGAFDINLASDLPLFVDPFLLFNSSKPEYQELHDEIIRYLTFLRDRASSDLDPGLVKAWYRFKEVKQNWLGFTLFGNDGLGLGAKFARALHASLGDILSSFGNEEITASSHLEKLTLVRPGVGRDGISDFTTNLIKGYLLQFTEAFAREHLSPSQCRTVSVERAAFNYETESWETRSYYLPWIDGDFVLLTPSDILTRDDTWISHGDMVERFDSLPAALPDDQLRAQVANYFRRRLGKKPTRADHAQAVADTIRQYPELIDYYIKLKEETGDSARAISSERVSLTHRVLVEQVKKAVEDLESRTEFYRHNWTSYEEALERVHLFKDYVENQDGYRLINRAGRPFASEDEVQIFFGLLWCSSEFDANREPNNGRGPVDFKVSFGSGDKSLIEFKLGSNRNLKKNLQNQIVVYEKANRTKKSVKAILYYTGADEARVRKILKELKLDGDPSIVLIDARSDNKPSASKA